jgi:hypothetical protein
MTEVANTALIGKQTILEIETSTGVWYKIGEVRGITPPNAQASEEDATHMESPGGMIETIQGLTDPGDMSLEMNYRPGDAKDVYILAWRTAATNRNARITYSTGAVDTFPSFVKGYTPGQMTPKGILVNTLTLRVAGAVTRT